MHLQNFIMNLKNLDPLICYTFYVVAVLRPPLAREHIIKSNTLSVPINITYYYWRRVSSYINNS